MECPSCGAPRTPEAVFCPQCGARLSVRCEACGAVNAPTHRFCAECGRTLVAPAPRAAEPRTDEGERRQLTVMFCDLVGSTTLAVRLDPEEWADVVRRYQEACARVVAENEGHVAQYLGDGLLVYFGFPQAHEDDARRAVRAGLGVVDAVRAIRAPAGPTEGLPLAVRVGIHTGPVVVGRVGGGGRHEELAIGETPNVAARLEASAEPDTVVISAVTHRLTHGAFACEALGPQALRGLSQPLESFRVLHEAPAPDDVEDADGAGRTPLVGREQEIGLLLERWELVKDGIGQVVVLTGEPGIGKSRLVQVVKGRLAAESHTALESRGSPYSQSSALHSAIELLQRLLELRAEDGPRERLARLEAALDRHGLPAAEVLPLLASLLSLPDDARHPPPAHAPQARKQRTLEAVLRLILAAAAERSVLLIVEDLHWIDPSSLELLALLVEQAPTARLLVLLTARPEFRVPWPPRSHLTRITLNRFTRKQSGAMVERVTGGKTLPAEVFGQIVARTDGVPLFVEELTKTVLESGLLREADDRWELTGPLPPLAIPATLHDSLMARLDRLGPAKSVAQVAAVLGRQFSYELLQAVWAVDDGGLGDGLARLVEAELLYQRGVPPHATYAFKHGLVQDTAYQSLLRSTRQRCHRRTAEALVARFPETVETQPELVAHHFAEADLGEPAIAYWQRAGQRALERSANIEAIGHVRRALELLRARADTTERARQELQLQTTLGSVLMAAEGYAAPEVERAYGRARELCEQLGDESQLFTTLRGLWGVHVVRANLKQAHELGEQCLALARRARRPIALVWAHYALGMTLFQLGQPAAARPHLQESLASYDREKRRMQRALQDPGVACLSYTATALWHQGYPDRAQRTSREAIVLARDLGHPFSLAYALTLAAVIAQFCHEVDETQALAVTASAVSSEHEIGYFLAWGPILNGWALAAQGRIEEGIAEQRRGLTAYVATGAALSLPYFLALVADAHRRGGQIHEGLEVLAEAQSLVNRTEERWVEPEIHRLQGELLLGDAAPGEGQLRHEPAERHFRQALEVARRQGQTSLELRAATSLGRLRRAQGRADEARGIVADVYGRFTEGFDTHDLREAKTLL
ncbi:MAG: AAA family ATPase [Candidatus Rokuibacteriota bacterium]